MKKIFYVLLILFVSASLMYSASNSFSFKVGYYMPAELESGIIWGADYGYVIDENVSLILGGDFYYKNIRNITKTGEIESVGVKQEQFQEISDWTGYYIPITAKVKIKFPVRGYRFKPYGVGGIGFGLTHVSIEGTDISSQSQEDSLTYTGFVWQLGGGIMYRIGSRSNLLMELVYNGAKFEKEDDNYFTTLDSSGLMLRAGIHVLLF